MSAQTVPGSGKTGYAAQRAIFLRRYKRFLYTIYIKSRPIDNNICVVENLCINRYKIFRIF
ncbi:hypothetical protein AXF15_09885 [Desulfomicrobium orale DSM 12838]|uniref:Uncharacterized protein n=1 Tax=Desulfomicrobium orale DSM 12838 TaxID=888061 RepID=A0A120KN87_9BACT|nr:hypothetical protein AXF15_09885 [Desulfomicrobium orale DSM 12838]